MATTVIAFDSETDLIRPGRCAPPMACLTWQTPGQDPQIIHGRDAGPLVEGWLRDPNVRLVGHNVAYDLAVVAEAFPHLRGLIFDAYDADRVTDTMIRQWLLDNAAGWYRGRPDEHDKWITFEYTLEALAKRIASIELKKDGWRLSYGNFLNVPLSDWPRHAVSVQGAALPRFTELEVKASGLGKDAPASLKKEIEGLREMISSDPEQCLRYPLDDARATLRVYINQERHAVPYLVDQFRQARAYFALYLSSVWGLRTDKAGVESLRRATEAELAEVEEELQMLGLVRADGSRDTKVAKARMVEVCRRERRAIPRTDAHMACVKEAKKIGDPDQAKACTEHVCLDADACEASEDEVLMSYAKLTTLNKMLSNDIAALAGGTHYPVHTRYGFAATGRTTSSKPNIQNQSRKEGVREAFIARPGKVFAECDFPSLELYTLAQCCMSWLGASKLAEALNGGLDPHLWLASYMLRMSYDDVHVIYKNGAHPRFAEVKKVREMAKKGNFGFPGGMGIEKFQSSVRKDMGRKKFNALFGFSNEEQIERIRELKERWVEAWPENKAYFARVNSLLDEDTGRATKAETLFTGRIRGNATYCATANNGFQALGSDCAKRAAWLLAKACYEDRGSPLFNARVVAFVHDEYIAEVDDGPGAHAAAYELARLMAVGANEFLPDVPIPLAKMEPVLMRRWSKKAATVLDARGRLAVWDDVQAVAA